MHDSESSFIDIGSKLKAFVGSSNFVRNNYIEFNPFIPSDGTAIIASYQTECCLNTLHTYSFCGVTTDSHFHFAFSVVLEMLLFWNLLCSIILHFALGMCLRAVIIQKF